MYNPDICSVKHISQINKSVKKIKENKNVQCSKFLDHVDLTEKNFPRIKSYKLNYSLYTIILNTLYQYCIIHLYKNIPSLPLVKVTQ